MVGVPAVTPLTTPPLEIVASPELLLVHVPPLVPSANVILDPVQTLVGPVIATGVVLTVSICVAIQPVGNVYVMLGVPAATPVTTPETEPTVAFVASLLLHTPPVVASARPTVVAVHSAVAPVMAAGFGLTVTGVVA